MRSFHCPCGQRVFFDSTACVACGQALGFDAETLDIVSLDSSWRSCANGAEHGICNWIIPADTPDRYCLACGLNDIVPTLDNPANLVLWGRCEASKRRLLYNLLSLRLPLQTSNGDASLRFRFMEDRRRNPNVLEDFVGTGHWQGTITINIREADDVERTAERQAMQESYRTLLGHFRHESGHFFYGRLVSPQDMTVWRALFGDETEDYSASISRYYEQGAPADWPARFVSAYASAHPYEDWAETFAHYLHIVDALETAHEAGLARLTADGHAAWILEWMRLSVTLNELNRSLGTEDPYPFVLTGPVIQKLEFIDQLVNRLVESLPD